MGHLKGQVVNKVLEPQVRPRVEHVALGMLEKGFSADEVVEFISRELPKEEVREDLTHAVATRMMSDNDDPGVIVRFMGLSL